MGVISEDLAKRSLGKYIRGEEFDGAGLLLEVVGFAEGTSQEYGADEKNWLVKEGKLKLGGTFVYTFKGVDGETAGMERVFESNSPGMFIAFSQTNPDIGTKVQISRVGKTSKTRYTVIKV